MISEHIILKFLEQVNGNIDIVARIATVLLKHAFLPVSTEFIERTSGLPVHQTSNITEILRAFENAGFCLRGKAEGTWVNMIDTCDFSYLISILEAVSLYNRVHMDKDEVEVVLTVPEQPSRLVEVMPHQGPYFAKLGATDSAFMKIARDATRRLVIASPFIDKAGAEWIVNLFNLTADKEIERYLIFRDYDSIKTYLMPHADLIKQLSIKLCDYFIHHEDRNPPYETFHAKMVLGDDTRAYVGSANMLGSSLAVCLEVGVVMKGKSVLDIKRLIDSMIEVAKIVE